MRQAPTSAWANTHFNASSFPGSTGFGISSSDLVRFSKEWDTGCFLSGALWNHLPSLFPFITLTQLSLQSKAAFLQCLFFFFLHQHWRWTHLQVEEGDRELTRARVVHCAVSLQIAFHVALMSPYQTLFTFSWHSVLFQSHYSGIKCLNLHFEETLLDVTRFM